MRPHYSSFPRPSNQAHPTGSSAPPQQLQPQLGIKNPQTPIQFSNSNSQLSNWHGGTVPNMPPAILAQHHFMNVPNNLIPMQNSNLGITQFGSVGPTAQPGQPHSGFFGSPNNPQTMNSISPFQLQGQLCNLVQNLNQVLSSQQPGQFFGNNMLNFPQQMNQNMGFPYGQFCLPNAMQNMNQFLPMQNPYPVGSNYAFGGPNQAPQPTISQNAPSFGNQQFRYAHSNHVGQQGNQNQQNSVPPPLQGTQGNPTNSSSVNNSNSNSKHSLNKSFIKHSQRGVQHQRGFQNSQFHHVKNAKQKFALPNGHKGKGFRNEREGKFTNQGGERKSCLFQSYTEQEIQQWREERRKHYPSNSNIEKKLSEKLINAELIEREAKTRREQLKEILTKQAELGVEVAEIPSCYLGDSNPSYGREENGSVTKGKFPNKFGKRERYDKKDRFGKRQTRQRSHHNDSSNDPSFNKREPTLLQKLLSVDIRRDRSHLLQVFRFMMTNSFFKDCPEKPLKFPAVAFKESGYDTYMAAELSSLAEIYACEESDKFMAERTHDNDYEDQNAVMNYDDGGDEDDEKDGIKRAEEEEGEIIN